MGLIQNQLSRLEILHNSLLLPTSVMIKGRGLRWLGHTAHHPDDTGSMVKQLIFDTRVPGTCAAYWTALWHVALGCIML